MKKTKKIDLAPASIQGHEVICDDITSCNYDIKQFGKLQTEIDERFTPKKKRSVQLAGFYLDSRHEKKYLNRAMRVAECGSVLDFAVGQSASLIHANFCKDRLCPMCNWRRSLKIFSQVSQCLNVLQERGYTFLFLTLTVKNCHAQDLKETIDELYAGWRYLYNKNKIFKDTVAGTFRTLEITRNKFQNTYHPHLHCILVVPADYFINGYLSQAEWTSLWQKACKLEYNPIVHIEKFKEEDGSYKKAIAEVSKYCAKDTDYLLTFEITDTFLNALRNRRLCGYTGVFADVHKELNLEDPEQGDLLKIDENSIREDVANLIVRYSWRYGFYERQVLKNENRK